MSWRSHSAETPASWAATWHAADWPGAISTRFGVTWWQSSIAIGHRSRNRQPGVGSTTLGGSPAVMDDVTANGERGSGTAATSSWVYGCFGSASTSSIGPGLHHVARVHDDHPVGDVAGTRDVVGDVEERDTLLLPQVRHQVEQTDADRDVQHRHRLVGEDHLGPVGQGLREADALALSAGELIGVAVEDVRLRATAPPPRPPAPPPRGAGPH